MALHYSLYSELRCGQNISQIFAIVNNQATISLKYTRSSWLRLSKISAIKHTIVKYMQCHYKFFWSKFAAQVQTVVECHPLVNILKMALNRLVEAVQLHMFLALNNIGINATNGDLAC